MRATPGGHEVANRRRDDMVTDLLRDLADLFHRIDAAARPGHPYEDDPAPYLALWARLAARDRALAERADLLDAALAARLRDRATNWERLRAAERVAAVGGTTPSPAQLARAGRTVVRVLGGHAGLTVEGLVDRCRDRHGCREDAVRWALRHLFASGAVALVAPGVLHVTGALVAPRVPQRRATPTGPARTGATLSAIGWIEG